MTSSVSEIRGGSQRPAADGREGLLSWAHAGPGVTAVVRCGLVVRGPDVAPVWPGAPARSVLTDAPQLHPPSRVESGPHIRLIG
jgi:hypothetical protein